MLKNLPAGNIRDTSTIPGSGRFPGGGHGNPLQYSCLKNPMDRGAWRAIVHRVANSWTGQSDLASTCSLPSVGFPGGSDGKESACNKGDSGSIPGSGRSPKEGNGNPL